ncbi:MAG: AIM24 family protein, partial [Alphaproteobacteria bacterium]
MYDITYTIHGTSMEIVEFILFPGQFIQAEIGSMIYMGDSVEMKTGTGGGIWKGLKRKLAGERFLVSQFKNRGIEKSYVGIGSYYPGKIQMINLSSHDGLY